MPPWFPSKASRFACADSMIRLLIMNEKVEVLLGVATRYVLHHLRFGWRVPHPEKGDYVGGSWHSWPAAGRQLMLSLLVVASLIALPVPANTQSLPATGASTAPAQPPYTILGLNDGGSRARPLDERCRRNDLWGVSVTILELPGPAASKCETVSGPSKMITRWIGRSPGHHLLPQPVIFSHSPGVRPQNRAVGTQHGIKLGFDTSKPCGKGVGSRAARQDRRLADFGHRPYTTGGADFPGQNALRGIVGDSQDAVGDCGSYQWGFGVQHDGHR